MAGTLSSSGGRRGGMISGINVTPLVDVVLVLLIILMVSATYIVSQTLKVQLPKSKSTDGSAEKPTTVVVLKSGALLYDGQPMAEDEVSRLLQAGVAKDADMSLVVSGDAETPHGKVVHLIDVAKLAGVQKFAINVQQTN
jgi:biopolymer transport protein ExbD